MCNRQLKQVGLGAERYTIMLDLNYKKEFVELTEEVIVYAWMSDAGINLQKRQLFASHTTSE
jgi:hypothetical protein